MKPDLLRAWRVPLMLCVLAWALMVVGLVKGCS